MLPRCAMHSWLTNWLNLDTLICLARNTWHMCAECFIGVWLLCLVELTNTNGTWMRIKEKENCLFVETCVRMWWSLATDCAGLFTVGCSKPCSITNRILQTRSVVFSESVGGGGKHEVSNRNHDVAVTSIFILIFSAKENSVLTTFALFLNCAKVLFWMEKPRVADARHTKRCFVLDFHHTLH